MKGVKDQNDKEMGHGGMGQRITSEGGLLFGAVYGRKEER